MGSVMRCLRQHFWRYEVGLTTESTKIELQIGSAWARAMEVRWLGRDYDAALAAAVPVGIDLDIMTVEMIGALLAGYYDRYGDDDVVHAEPEYYFNHSIIRSWSSRGLMDCNATRGNRRILIESKTTSYSLDADSEYWLRLRFNLQILNYASAARYENKPFDFGFYDVTRKPRLRPKKIPTLDADGKKIVINEQGQRVFLDRKKKDGSVVATDKPKQSADIDLGQTLQSRPETPAEYSDRLYQDIRSRFDFYFKRREIPILEKEINAFERQRLAIISIIEGCRAQEQTTPECVAGKVVTPRDPEAWPRNVCAQNCNFCQFKSFCLTNATIDPAKPPQGFYLGQFNPELEAYADPSEETIDEPTPA